MVPVMQAGAVCMQGADQVPAAVQDRISQQCTSLPHAATGVAEGEQGKTWRRQGKLIVRTRTVPFDKQGPRFHHQRWRRGSMHCYSVFFNRTKQSSDILDRLFCSQEPCWCAARISPHARHSASVTNWQQIGYLFDDPARIPFFVRRS
jgi:hypothetical protein